MEEESGYIRGIMECSNCGAEARQSRADYPLKEFKSGQVVLKDVEVIHCDGCGNDDVIVPALDGLISTLSDLGPSGSENAIALSYAPRKGWFVRP